MVVNWPEASILAERVVRVLYSSNWMRVTPVHPLWVFPRRTRQLLIENIVTGVLDLVEARNWSDLQVLDVLVLWQFVIWTVGNRATVWEHSDNHGTDQIWPGVIRRLHVVCNWRGLLAQAVILVTVGHCKQ